MLLTFFTILSFLFALGGVFVQIGFFHCSNWRGFLVKPICKRLQKWKLQKRLAKRAVSDRTDTTFHRLTGMTHPHASSTQQKHATTHQNTATAHVWDAQFDCHGTITHQMDETTVRFCENSNAAVQWRSKLVRWRNDLMEIRTNSYNIAVIWWNNAPKRWNIAVIWWNIAVIWCDFERADRNFDWKTGRNHLNDRFSNGRVELILHKKPRKSFQPSGFGSGQDYLKTDLMEHCIVVKPNWNVQRPRTVNFAFTKGFGAVSSCSICLPCGVVYSISAYKRFFAAISRYFGSSI